MDLEKLKKRIYAFYFAGTINLFLGFYVLLYGHGVDASTRNIMLLFFFGFTALDFWFPSHLKKKFIEQQEQLIAQLKAEGKWPPPDAVNVETSAGKPKA